MRSLGGGIGSVGRVPRSVNMRSLPDLPAYPIPVDRVVIEIRADPHNPGGRLVLQDGVESSYIDLAHPQRLGFEYQRHLAGIVDVMHPKRLPLAVLQIGGGPCAVMRYLDATRRDLRALVAEIDPGVVEVAERYLGLVQSQRLRMIAADGRAALAEVGESSLDLLVVDAFVGLVVPHALVTRQFVELARRALRPGAIHVINLIDIAPYGLATATAATLAQAYANVVVMADPQVLHDGASGNFVVAASDTPIPVELVARRAAHDTEPWQVLSGRPLARWIASAAPLDDDVAPDHELARLGDLFGRTRRPHEKEPQ